MPGEDINWEELLTVDTDAVETFLIEEINSAEIPNITCRFFKLVINGDDIDEDGLIEFIKTQAIKFCLSNRDIREFEEDGKEPLDEALKRFGDVDPLSDGKYGELILYILTEAILRTPMIVQKLNFTPPNVQAKGADGIFQGFYNGLISILIGESKMRQQYSICLTDAIESIERFEEGGEFYEDEFFIAKNNLFKDLEEDLDEEDFNYIYNSMRTTRPEHQENQIVHPVFLMYKEPEIAQFKAEGTIAEELSNALSTLLETRKTARMRTIQGKCQALAEAREVLFEFFLLPVENVNEFREKCYAAFHNGIRYVRP